MKNLFLIKMPLPANFNVAFKWKKSNKREIMRAYYTHHSTFFSYYQDGLDKFLRMGILSTTREIARALNEAEKWGYDIYILDKVKC